ncbi:MAG: zinc ribbon domain-containing protein [FCB group bacterium]|nr:zinc ribbon domain-containing protein [FCB group bacterium]
MKKQIWLLAVLSFGAIAWGQKITSLEADIYPEYYSQGVMVEYLGETEPGTLTPALHFMLPAGTDSAFSVVEIEGQKDPLITDLKLEQRGSETWVTVAPRENKFRFFAFYTPFTNPVGKRDFQFSIKSDSDFPHYHILVQEPMMAQGFALHEPDDEPESFPDQHGITFHRFHYEALKAGEVQSLGIEYVNPTGKLTMETLQTMLNTGGPNAMGGGSNTQVAANAAPKRFTLPTWQPYLALAAITLIVAFNYKRFPAMQSSKASTPITGKQPETGKTARKNNFCTQCGKPVSSGDKFCSSCGCKL